MREWLKRLKDKRVRRVAYYVQAVGWVTIIPIGLLTGLKDSVPFIFVMSAWALASSALAAAEALAA